LEQVYQKEYFKAIINEGQPIFAVGIGFEESGAIEEEILVREIPHSQ
jgi:hypothetical protein